MKLNTRLKKLESSTPRCEPGITRIVRNGEPTAADRCPRCGGSHTLYVQEVIVHSRAEADRYRAMNDA